MGGGTVPAVRRARRASMGPRPNGRGMVGNAGGEGPRARRFNGAATYGRGWWDSGFAVPAGERLQWGRDLTDADGWKRAGYRR